MRVWNLHTIQITKYAVILLYKYSKKDRAYSIWKEFCLQYTKWAMKRINLSHIENIFLLFSICRVAILMTTPNSCRNKYKLAQATTLLPPYFPSRPNATPMELVKSLATIPVDMSHKCSACKFVAWFVHFVSICACWLSISFFCRSNKVCTDRIAFLK